MNERLVDESRCDGDVIAVRARDDHTRWCAHHRAPPRRLPHPRGSVGSVSEDRIDRVLGLPTSATRDSRRAPTRAMRPPTSRATTQTPRTKSNRPDAPFARDSNATRAVVAKWSAFYRAHRGILTADVVHLKRPDMQGLDAILHADARDPEGELGMLVVFNPTDAAVETELRVPLYYTGLDAKARVEDDAGAASVLALDRGFAVTLPLMMIATTVHIQKLSSDASMRPSGGDGETVEEIHEANYALLNRTCAGGLVPVYGVTGDMKLARLVARGWAAPAFELLESDEEVPAAVKAVANAMGR